MLKRNKPLTSLRKIVIQRIETSQWKREVYYKQKERIEDRRKRNPLNWKTEIVPRILARVGYRCRKCGIERYAVGEWDTNGQFTRWRQGATYGAAVRIAKGLTHILGRKQAVVTLACCHLENPDPRDCRNENLAIMCNYHHALFDTALRQRYLIERRETKQEQAMKMITEQWIEEDLDFLCEEQSY